MAKVTVNDVMMTAMAGCVRRCVRTQWLLHRIYSSDLLFQILYRACRPIGEWPQFTNTRTYSCCIRKVLPCRLFSGWSCSYLTFRPPAEAEDEQAALRNKWCLVSADMHVREADCKKRLETQRLPSTHIMRYCLCCRLLQICQTMTTIKTTPVAPVTMWFQDNILHMLPRIIAQKASYDSFSRHSMVTQKPFIVLLLAKLAMPRCFQTYLALNKQCTLPTSSCWGNNWSVCVCVFFSLCELHSIQVLYPNLLPQVIALSYNGGIFMNIVVDPQLIT